jgi:hypothetical protein
LTAGQWLQRAIEACHKAKNCVDTLETRFAELEAFNVAGEQWFPSGADEALKSIETSRSRIVFLLSLNVPELCRMRVAEDLPDFLGQTRAWLTDELITLMELKQEWAFPNMFKAYFSATISVHTHFMNLAQEPGKEAFCRASMDACLDLMDVSGLAFLFSELDGTRFGQYVKTAWDRFFDKAESEAATIQDLFEAVDSKWTLSAFSTSALKRQEWGRRLVVTLSDRGVDTDRYSEMLHGRHSIVPHPSFVIDSIVVSFGYPSADAYEYFGALYLCKRRGAEGIAVPSLVQNRLDAIALAKSRRQETEEGNR